MDFSAIKECTQTQSEKLYTDYCDNFAYIDQIQEVSMERLIAWSNINSHSYNIAGIEHMADEVHKTIQDFEQRIQKKKTNFKLAYEYLNIDDLDEIGERGTNLKVKMAKCFRVRKISPNPDAINIFFGGHLDTVFPVNSSFQEAKYIQHPELNIEVLNGPGVADLKGGLIVMINALETFEQTDLADNVSWEILFNSEEEIGSKGSDRLFAEAASRNDVGLIYEPSLPDGSLAFRRKGSGNFFITVAGKPAHVGRAFSEGASATVVLAEIIVELDKLNEKYNNLIVNTGAINGGGPLNVVSDYACAGINIRLEENTDVDIIYSELDALITRINLRDNIQVQLHGGITRMPKVPNSDLENFFNIVQKCGKVLNLDIAKRNTGGCCDGNNTYSYGLVNIDTLGVRGGDIHSDTEYMIPESLAERTKLSLLILLNFAKYHSSI